MTWLFLFALSAILIAAGLTLLGVLRVIPTPRGRMTLYRGKPRVSGILLILLGLLVLVLGRDLLSAPSGPSGTAPSLPTLPAIPLTVQTAVQEPTATVPLESIPPTLTLEGPATAIPPGEVSLKWKGSDNTTPAAQLAYRFRLTGTSERRGYPTGNWSPWVTETEVIYHDVPKGSYTFTVQARDEAGNVAQAEWTFKVE